MKIYSSCSCGKSSLEVRLSRPLSSYTPRACDCDYCTARRVAYLSDPEGEVKVTQGKPFHIDTHGSEQAGFYTCPDCKDLMFVAVKDGDRLIGAINAGRLLDSTELPKAQTVSPKLLPANEKLARWRQLWMPVYL